MDDDEARNLPEPAGGRREIPFSHPRSETAGFGTRAIREALLPWWGGEPGLITIACPSTRSETSPRILAFRSPRLRNEEKTQRLRPSLPASRFVPPEEGLRLAYRLLTVNMDRSKSQKGSVLLIQIGIVLNPEFDESSHVNEFDVNVGGSRRALSVA